MSDKIREKYKNTYSEIEPRAEFLESLAQTLENEQAKQKRSKINMLKPIVSAAACFAIVAGAAVMISNSNLLSKPDDSESDIDNDAVSSSQLQSDIDNYGESLSISGLPIKIDDWNTEDMTAVECAEFMQTMLAGDELSYIMVSDSNIFTDADETDSDETEMLIEMFSDCEETDKAEYEEEERVYYMAVFEDGLIIKFNVIDDEYIEIPMKEIYLEIQ